MTQKDYILIASVLNECYQGIKDVGDFAIFDRLVMGFSRELKRDNERFNRVRFERAVFKSNESQAIHPSERESESSIE